MSITEVQERILCDAHFVLEETKKIQYLYGLQSVIRNHLERNEEIETESVAEHVHAMAVLTQYFLPLEDAENKLNKARIHELITWHDIDEIETGDVIGYKKTAADRKREAAATQVVLHKTPDHITNEVATILEEYKAQTTPESRFVKAIDKIDPVFYLYNSNGKKLFKLHNATKDEHCRIKIPYVKNYPYINRFFEVITDQLEKEDFFCD